MFRIVLISIGGLIAICGIAAACFGGFDIGNGILSANTGMITNGLWIGGVGVVAAFIGGLIAWGSSKI